MQHKSEKAVQLILIKDTLFPFKTKDHHILHISLKLFQASLYAFTSSNQRKIDTLNYS